MDGAVALEGRPLTTSTHKPGSGPRFQSVTPVRTSRRCAPRPVDAVEAARGCLHFRAFVRTSLFSPSFPLTSPPPWTVLSPAAAHQIHRDYPLPSPPTWFQLNINCHQYQRKMNSPQFVHPVASTGIRCGETCSTEQFHFLDLMPIAVELNPPSSIR